MESSLVPCSRPMLYTNRLVSLMSAPSYKHSEGQTWEMKKLRQNTFTGGSESFLDQRVPRDKDLQREKAAKKKNLLNVGWKLRALMGTNSAT